MAFLKVLVELKTHSCKNQYLLLILPCDDDNGENENEGCAQAENGPANTAKDILKKGNKIIKKVQWIFKIRRITS